MTSYLWGWGYGILILIHISQGYLGFIFISFIV